MPTQLIVFGQGVVLHVLVVIKFWSNGHSFPLFDARVIILYVPVWTPPPHGKLHGPQLKSPTQSIGVCGVDIVLGVCGVDIVLGVLGILDVLGVLGVYKVLYNK